MTTYPRIAPTTVELDDRREERRRQWYRNATEAEFELIIDHIREVHDSIPDHLTPAMRADAIDMVDVGLYDSVREHANGARHYLLADLGVTVYVSELGSAFVDRHDDIDKAWKTILVYQPKNR
jgi:hypothetical protein